MSADSSEARRVIGLDSEALLRELDFWFNESSRGCVVLVTGDWGVGKTHTWSNEFKPQHSFAKYAEVSLFGLKTSDQIERALLTQFSLSGSGSTESSLRRKFGLSAGDVARELLQTEYGKLANGLIDAASEIVFTKNRGATVMLDDIERRQEGFSMRALLGVVSKLKEKYEMRVAILLNEERIEESSWSEFKEKVVDAQFRLTIAPERAARLGLVRCDWAVDAASMFARRVDIQNIRLFQRIDTFLSRLRLNVAHYPKPVLDRLVNSVTGLAWARFCPGPEVPTTQMMTTDSWGRYFAENDDPDKSDPRLSMLDKLRWNPDVMDVWVDRAWETGFGVDDTFQGNMREYLEDHARLEASAMRNAAWSVYSDRVFGGDLELVDGLLKAYEKHAVDIPLSSLIGDVGVLKSIDKSDIAQRILNLHEKNWHTLRLNERFWDASAHVAMDADIAAAIRRLPNIERAESFCEWMRRLGASSTWSERDADRVRETSLEEWQSSLAEIRDEPWISDAIQRCRRIYSHSDSQSRFERQKGMEITVSNLDRLLFKLETEGTPLERVRARRLLQAS